MEFADCEITVTGNIIRINGAAACFATRRDYLEYLAPLDAPIEVNLDGDAYANDDHEDHHRDTVIPFCLAWSS